MAILYRHIRLDKNVPFYIGIGIDESRAYNKRDRNVYWKRVVGKTDYEVEILFYDLTWQEACDKEREFIKLYGRADLRQGTLCNLTDGGEGQCNPAEYVRKINSKAHKGHKYNLGRKMPDHVKDAISKANKGRQAHNKGKKINEETRKKISEAKKGSYGPWTGKKRSEETKKKLRENNAKGMSKKVIDTVTGTVYPSIQSAADFLGIKQHTLARYLRNMRTDKTSFKFYENK